MICVKESQMGGLSSSFMIGFQLQLLAMDLRTITRQVQMRLVLPLITSLPTSVFESYLENKEVA